VVPRKANRFRLCRLHRHVIWLTCHHATHDRWSRLGKAALVFQCLNGIWSSHSINSTINFRLYTSIVLSTALHACETWKSTASIRNTLDVFHCRCIRKILGLSWQDHVTNEELIRDASPIRDSANPEAEIGRSRTTIAWRQTCMCSHHLDTRIWWKNLGRPQETWCTSFKERLHGMNLTWHGARRATNSWHWWRNFVTQCPVWDRN